LRAWPPRLPAISITNTTQIAASAADQTLLSYLWYAYSGTTLTLGSMNTTQSAALTSFSASTTATSDTWTGNTMALWVESGVVYVGGAEVKFAGGITPTVTAPAANPRIDVLTISILTLVLASVAALAGNRGSQNIV